MDMHAHDHAHHEHDHGRAPANAGTTVAAQKHDHQSDADAGHDHGAMIADFRRRFWVSAVMTVPILLLSPMIQHWIGLGDALAFSGSDYVLFALSSVVFSYDGWPFLTGIESFRKPNRLRRASIENVHGLFVSATRSPVIGAATARTAFIGMTAGASAWKCASIALASAP